MTITIIVVGKSRTVYHETAIAEYQKRLSRWTKLDWLVIPGSNQDNESQKILNAIPDGAHIVLLDERGVQWSTPELSEYLQTAQNQAWKQLVFIIGGAHGVSDTVRTRANYIWSLSKLVFPHEMVRLLLTEQLYRAYDIANNGKYHHP